MVSVPFSETIDSFFSLASSTFDGAFEGAVVNHSRNVVFSERVKVVEIPSARDLSRKERNSLWHPEPADPKTSKIRKLLCVIEDFSERDESREDDEGFDDSRERQRFPVTAVLMEQQSQRELGMLDEYFIAKVYQHCSAHSIMKAQMRALQHELEAKEYLGLSGRKRGMKLFRR